MKHVKFIISERIHKISSLCSNSHFAEEGPCELNKKGVNRAGLGPTFLSGPAAGPAYRAECFCDLLEIRGCDIGIQLI